MGTISILIVGDDIAAVEDIRRVIENKADFSVFTAASGQRALDMAKAHPIDLVLMDIGQEKGTDGAEITDCLKDDYGIPIILMSTHLDKDMFERVKKRDSVGILFKPFNESELFSAIERRLTRRQAELKPKTTAQWLMTVLKSIGDAIITTDNSGEINYMNPVAEELTGWRFEEAEGAPLDTIIRLFDEYTDEELTGIVKNIMEYGHISPLSNQSIALSRNSKKIPVSHSGAPIMLDGSTIEGAVLVFHNDSIARAAAKTIRKSEEKYRSFVENFQGIAFKRDAEFTFEFLAGKIEDITGYDRDDFISKKIRFRDLIHLEDKNRIVNNAKNFMSSAQRSNSIEYRIRNKNGEYKWLSEHISKAKDRMGGIGFDGIIRDITKRKVAESHSQLLLIAMENTVEVVTITNRQGQIVYVNRAFETVTGYAKEEAIGRNPKILKSGEHSKQFYKEMWDTLTAQETWHGELINKKKDGTVYYEDVTISPVLNSEKETTHYIAVKRDITDELAKEKMLQQSQKMESIGTLAGGIAHDFNNILSPIIGFTQLSLSSVEKDSVLEDNLQEISKAAMRAKELVYQILTFARKSDQKAIPVKIYPVVKETLKFIRSSIPSNINIKSQIDNTAHVTADPTQIHQLVMNLCTNAYHAVGENSGNIKVTLKDVVIDSTLAGGKASGNLKDGKYVLLTVSDDGHGILPEDLDSIFDPYFTTKDVGEGTGLGLALCKGIVENMSGEIIAASEPGVETLFSVYMPSTDRPKNQLPDIFKDADLPRGKENILFVDDEIPITKMGKKFLENLGYSVTAVNSSTEAADLFTGNPDSFDLIITDMTMPDMTGDVLAKKIKKERPSIPIILCTGFSKKISEDEIENLGINGYCKKPISIPSMAKKVRRLLDQRR